MHRSYRLHVLLALVLVLSASFVMQTIVFAVSQPLIDPLLLTLTRPHLTTASDYPFLQYDGDTIVVDAVASDDVTLLQTELRTLGFRTSAVVGPVVSGQLPIAALPHLTDMQHLRQIRPVSMTTSGTQIVTEGDTALQVAVARERFGVTGRGVTVGIISDSFDCLRGYAADVAAGELPPDVQIVQDWMGVGCTDEGRAMAQVVYDLAPDARLLFWSGFGAGSAGLAQAYLELADAGAHVIVDDVQLFFEPRFQDSIVAQAIDAVTARDVVVVVAAGNDADHGYLSVWRPTAAAAVVATCEDQGGGTAHDFNPGPEVDVLQRISITPDTWFVLALHWDEPYISAGSQNGAASDLDVYLVDAAGRCIGVGGLMQNIGGDPTEVICWWNYEADTTDTLQVMIVHRSGPPPRMISYTTFALRGSIDDFPTYSNTLNAHANAQGALAVGAAYYQLTPAFGQSPALIEPFSAIGGMPILFAADGTRLAAQEVRQKPDVVAVDGVSTTFFGVDIDSDNRPEFRGTSAAAPHVAAIVALVREADPALTPAEIRSLLLTTAHDMETPGFDVQSGAGLVDAAAVLRQLRGTRVALPLLSMRGGQ